MKEVKYSGERLYLEHIDEQRAVMPNIEKVIKAHLGRYRFARSLLSETDVVLDIACGSGYGSKMMSEVCRKVYGVDVSDEAIQHAKDNYSAENIEFVKCGMEDLTVGVSVDAIISFETLEHVANGTEEFMKAFTLLKPGGLCVISVPVRNIPTNRFHINNYSLDDFEKFLEKYFGNRYTLFYQDDDGLSFDMEKPSNPYIVLAICRKEIKV